MAGLVTQKPRFLVVGGDGMLGRHLAHHLQTRGDVLQTTRRPGATSPNRVLLDLASDLTACPIPRGVTAAFLCAGISSLARCSREREQSELINVTQTIALASRLVEHGVHVIYPSSSRVFDGTKAFCAPADPTAPVTVYGRQKVAVETALASLEGDVTILRITKVIDRRVPLIAEWERDLRASRHIHPFCDRQYAPVSLQFVGDVCARVAMKRRAGILHVSSDGEISYEATARQLARLIGCNERLIEPVSAADRLRDRDDIPAHSVLDTVCLESELGLRTPRTLDSVAEGLAA